MSQPLAADNGENPFNTLAQTMETLRATYNYGLQDACLDRISELFRQLVDTRPADPQLAEMLPSVIGILDEHSYIYDSKSLDALEYVEPAAIAQQQAGNDALVRAIAQASTKMADIRKPPSLSCKPF